MASSKYSEEKSMEFRAAVTEGDFSKAKDLSKDPQVNINWQDVYGWTALHYACCDGRTKEVCFLLGLDGLEPNLPTHNGFTAFDFSSEHEHSKIVNALLIDPRIDVNKPNYWRDNPIWTAAYRGHISSVERLLGSGRFIDANAILKCWSLDNMGERIEGGLRYIRHLISRYEKNPAVVMQELVEKFRIQDIGKLFALVIYSADGYLKPAEKKESVTLSRFFFITTRLPIELQMLLCHRVFGSSEFMVPTKHSESAFKEYAKEE